MQPSCVLGRAQETPVTETLEEAFSQGDPYLQVLPPNHEHDSQKPWRRICSGRGDKLWSRVRSRRLSRGLHKVLKIFSQLSEQEFSIFKGSHQVLRIFIQLIKNTFILRVDEYLPWIQQNMG